MKYLPLYLVLISLVTINPRINGWNEASRMALTQAVVEHHELTIDQSIFSTTGDKVFINGHFYSDKPSTPSMLAAIVYFPLYHLGAPLAFGWNLAYYLIIFFVVKVLWILSVLAFSKVMGHFGLNDRRRLINTLIFALASQAFTWSSTFNNHSIAASCLMIALALFVSGRKSKNATDLLVSGFLFGLAAASDLPTGLFLLGFAWLIFRSTLTSVHKSAFILAGCLPLSSHLLINYQIGGTVLPLQFFNEYFVFPGSQWTEGVRVNGPLAFFKYITLSLVGPLGFLWYSPLLIILIPLLIKHTGKGRAFYEESRVIAICSTLLMLNYFLLTQNYGGWGYGIRWFVPLLPLVYIYLFDSESVLKTKGQRLLFKGLVSYSFIVAVIGLVNPWSNPEYHPIPVIANLLQLRQFIF